MSLQKRDKEFRLPKISYLDFKQTEMDRVLTVLFSRIQHHGKTSRLTRASRVSIDTIQEEFLSRPDWFEGFKDHPDAFRRWLETHLLDLVNRGKPDQALAAPRPLHGLTYRYRNAKHCRDYGASQQIYEMLRNARNGIGINTLERLKTFFFAGIDSITDRLEDGAIIDVETQALLRLTHQIEQDAPDTSVDETYPPMCIGAADLMADDVTRLLIYKDFIPRSIMVDYLKILFSLHLALYHLRLMKLLPIMVKKTDGELLCALDRCPPHTLGSSSSNGECPYQIGIVVDVANLPGKRMAELASHSADFHYRRIATFLKSYFAIRKLDEFGAHLEKIGRIPPNTSLSVADIVALQKPQWQKEREKFFGGRLVSLLETEGKDTTKDPELEAISQLGLDDFNFYIECVYLLASSVPRKNYVRALDSLLLKNRPGALLAQGRAKGGARRFVLDSRLLEVLLQIAVLQSGGSLGYRTAEIKIEDLLTLIRERYGIFIDRLPEGEGFGPPSIEDRDALRSNLEAFKSKLREIGFYQDLSDAYITQNVTPRYVIKE